MSQSLKELLVIILLTSPIWIFGRALFEGIFPPGVFKSRRNAWFAITIAGLIAPNISVYALLAVPIIIYSSSRDPNPIGLYIILFFALPNVTIDMNIFGMEIISIGHQRILAIFLMLPIFAREKNKSIGDSQKGWDQMGGVLIAFCLLGVFLDSPYMSLTHTLRQLLLGMIDSVIVYFVFSRLRDGAPELRDCMAAWLLSALLLSVVAIFEANRGWLLYSGLGSRWGNANSFAFLLREGVLRAQASTGHSLTLGIWLSTAWAFFLVIQRGWASLASKAAVGGLLLCALWACAARGAWVATVISTIIYLAMNPYGMARGMKGVLVFSLIVSAFLMSPLGEVVISYLPFVGSVDSANVDYRVRVFEVCIGLIKMNPVFGNPLAIENMESLRQGQGIIDLVNGYLRIAVFHGLAALILFAGFLFIAMFRGFTGWRLHRVSNPELSFLGASLCAALAGTMFFIATAGVDPMTYMLSGLLSSFAGLDRYPEQLSVS